MAYGELELLAMEKVPAIITLLKHSETFQTRFSRDGSTRSIAKPMGATLMRIDFSYLKPKLFQDFQVFPLQRSAVHTYLYV